MRKEVCYMDIKGLRILSLALTGAGALLTIATSVVSDKLLDGKITDAANKAVAKALSSKTGES
jgi:hypothetical protein